MTGKSIDFAVRYTTDVASLLVTPITVSIYPLLCLAKWRQRRVFKINKLLLDVSTHFIDKNSSSLFILFVLVIVLKDVIIFRFLTVSKRDA